MNIIRGVSQSWKKQKNYFLNKIFYKNYPLAGDYNFTTLNCKLLN